MQRARPPTPVTSTQPHPQPAGCPDSHPTPHLSERAPRNPPEFRFSVLDCRAGPLAQHTPRFATPSLISTESLLSYYQQLLRFPVSFLSLVRYSHPAPSSPEVLPPTLVSLHSVPHHFRPSWNRGVEAKTS